MTMGRLVGASHSTCCQPLQTPACVFLPFCTHRQHSRWRPSCCLAHRMHPTRPTPRVMQPGRLCRMHSRSSKPWRSSCTPPSTQSTLLRLCLLGCLLTGASHSSRWVAECTWQLGTQCLHHKAADLEHASAACPFMCAVGVVAHVFFVLLLFFGRWLAQLVLCGRQRRPGPMPTRRLRCSRQP